MSSFGELERLNTRTTSIVTVGGFRPTRNPLASHFGLTPVAQLGEAWPSHNKAPQMFVCQLGLTGAPHVPDLLKDIALITFFVDPNVGLRQKHSGVDWCLRAYRSLEGLVPLPPPDDAPRIERGFECQWEACSDHPTYDDPEVVVPDGFEPTDVGDLENVCRTKIGGYGSYLQSEPWWALRLDHPAAPTYCLQINSEEKVGLGWGDGGTVYIARGTTPGHEDEWFLDWQCF